jgi:hypothetical protein
VTFVGYDVCDVRQDINMIVAENGSRHKFGLKVTQCPEGRVAEVRTHATNKLKEVQKWR